MLELNAISKSFGGIRALSEISLTVRRGRIVGVIGPNGAGKTSLFNVITGAYRADSGEILLDGSAITQWPPYRIVRAGISRTFQNIRLFGSMTVWEHLLVAQPRSGASLYNILPVGLADRDTRTNAEKAMSLFGLEEYRDVLARTLPYGVQRKVEMARALTARPKLLLLDEPVAGMNHDEASELREKLLKINENGLSILLIEHDMAFVMNLCHELYVLDFGAIIAAGEPGQIRRDPVVLDAYLGREVSC
ncbi:MAG: ABC transporter ATP-binding protein [Bradyrhizobium sp.]